ncbi:hypothetical protein P4V58_08425 [Bacillus wiedmannii]|uniref:DUF2726 domain-containing protein n=1 Tax=Bacillus wiedmannii TaxID=1890302 RepID=UPI002E2101FA|nr:hypothetical protein [Bacillus wiedmannii]
MKTCKKCDESKPLSEFYKSKMHKEGYEHCCKKCRDAQRSREYTCTGCGKKFKAVKPNKFCSIECFGKTTRSDNEEMVRKIEQDGEYKLLSEYKTSRRKVDVMHVDCGKVFSATPNNILTKGSGCPFCRSSKGEILIRKILINNEISFSEQVRFKDCKFVNTLPFDFGIIKDKQIIGLIEYDGELHFKKKFRTEEEFELQKTRDKLKGDYCATKGIPLLRIPYTKKDEAESILLNTISTWQSRAKL